MPTTTAAGTPAVGPPAARDGAARVTALPREPAADDRLADAIVRAVAYADVFDFALTPAETHRFLVGESADLAAVERALDARAVGPGGRRWRIGAGLDGRVALVDGLVMLTGREHLAAVRAERRAASARAWPVCLRYARRVTSLPFVRMVAVTGALAAGNAIPGADIDLLVVTSDEHVWSTRAMTIVVVRAAARLGHDLCPNYFLAEGALALPDRDLYTAHELVQMVPLSGIGVYRRFREHNRWASRLLPNAGAAPPGGPAGQPWPATGVVGAPGTPGASTGHRLGHHDHARPGRTARRLRRAGQVILGTPLGTALERWERDRKVPRFREEARLAGDAAAAESSFTAERCKGHFEAHGARIRTAYEERARAAGVEPLWTTEDPA